MSDTYCTSQFGMVPKLVREKPYVMRAPFTGASNLRFWPRHKKHQLKAETEDADHTLTLWTTLKYSCRIKIEIIDVASENMFDCLMVAAAPLIGLAERKGDGA